MKYLIASLLVLVLGVSCTACVTLYNDSGSTNARSEVAEAQERMDKICKANTDGEFATKQTIISCKGNMCTLAQVNLICIDGEAKGETTIQDVPKNPPKKARGEYEPGPGEQAV